MVFGIQVPITPLQFIKRVLAQWVVSTNNPRQFLGILKKALPKLYQRLKVVIAVDPYSSRGADKLDCPPPRKGECNTPTSYGTNLTISFTPLVLPPA